MSFPAGTGLLIYFPTLLNKTHHCHRHKHSLVLCHCYLLLVCRVKWALTLLRQSKSAGLRSRKRRLRYQRLPLRKPFSNVCRLRDACRRVKTKDEPLRNLAAPCWIVVFISFYVVSSAVMQTIKEKIVFVLVNLSLRCCNSRYVDAKFQNFCVSVQILTQFINDEIPSLFKDHSCIHLAFRNVAHR